MTADKPPALLLMAEYNGTLAAARCLAGFGVSVTIGTSRLLAPARWSRFVSRVETAPAFDSGPSAVKDWLLQYGIAHPKSVLYPTCDEMAWLLAHHQSELSQYFHMYSPSGATLSKLLDKRALYAAAAQVGLESPRTFHPARSTELAGILQEVSACIVKPRTQTFFRTHAKGGLARNLSQLNWLWKHYQASGYALEVSRDMDDVNLPIVQEYLPMAAKRVISISGFAVRSGQIIASRSSCKVLQLPRSAGVGVCFETEETDPLLVERISALCASVGYFGTFEAEFVEHRGHKLLIDFNPRYFGQLSFDIARGMPLPWMAHLCATGNETQAAQVASAETAADAPTYYADSDALKWHLATGVLMGTLSRAERLQWRAWLASRPESFADAIRVAGDPAPSTAATADRVFKAFRHPIAFWRSTLSVAATLSGA